MSISIGVASTSAITPVSPVTPPPTTDTVQKPETSSPAVDARGPALSSSATAVLLEAQNKPSEPEPRSAFETYMPVREGFSAHAMAVGAENANAVSSSAGLDDAAVAADARARLDDKYARMDASGKPFSFNSYQSVDWYSAYGDLDARSLNSIISSQNGQFTEQEHTLATWALTVQGNMRQGAYIGPSRLYGQFIASGLSDMSSVDAADAMKAFDAVSADDKTVPTQLGRASMRVLLGNNGLFAGAETDPNDKMLNLLVDALTKARVSDPKVLDKIGNIKSVEDLKNADWFSDSRAALDKLTAEGGKLE